MVEGSRIVSRKWASTGIVARVGFEKGGVGEQRWIGQSRDERKEEEDATVERIPRVFSGLKPERP